MRTSLFAFLSVLTFSSSTFAETLYVGDDVIHNNFHPCTHQRAAKDVVSYCMLGGNMPPEKIMIFTEENPYDPIHIYPSYKNDKNVTPTNSNYACYYHPGRDELIIHTDKAFLPEYQNKSTPFTLKKMETVLPKHRFISENIIPLGIENYNDENQCRFSPALVAVTGPHTLIIKHLVGQKMNGFTGEDPFPEYKDEKTSSVPEINTPETTSPFILTNFETPLDLSKNITEKEAFEDGTETSIPLENTYKDLWACDLDPQQSLSMIYRWGDSFYINLREPKETEYQNNIIETSGCYYDPEKDLLKINGNSIQISLKSVNEFTPAKEISVDEFKSVPHNTGNNEKFLAPLDALSPTTRFKIYPQDHSLETLSLQFTLEDTKNLEYNQKHVRIDDFEKNSSGEYTSVYLTGIKNFMENKNPDLYQRTFEQSQPEQDSILNHSFHKREPSVGYKKDPLVTSNDAITENKSSVFDNATTEQTAALRNYLENTQQHKRNIATDAQARRESTYKDPGYHPSGISPITGKPYGGYKELYKDPIFNDNKDSLVQDNSFEYIDKNTSQEIEQYNLNASEFVNNGNVLPQKQLSDTGSVEHNISKDEQDKLNFIRGIIDYLTPKSDEEKNKKLKELEKELSKSPSEILKEEEAKKYKGDFPDYSTKSYESYKTRQKEYDKLDKELRSKGIIELYGY